MKLLAIETSCDETAVSMLDATGGMEDASFRVLGNALYSQVKKHAAYGGVYPSLAKREHAANLVPLLETVLKGAGMYLRDEDTFSDTQRKHVTQLLVRETGMAEALLRSLALIAKPKVDAIAVTQGPGLEPALWVGINFARALAYLWDMPIIPVNHLEGHLVASTVRRDLHQEGVYDMVPVRFPVLGLILSGGHTEFVYARAWGEYTLVGATRDDSIGEAFDKVARLLGLPYPGGPEISRLAEKGRPLLQSRNVAVLQSIKQLPRPMRNSGDLDFSFSGIKTAVKYLVRDLGDLTDDVKTYIAADFENAVTEVVLIKTKQALAANDAHTFVLGGGVSANTYLRTRLTNLFKTEETPFYVPAAGLSTDNAVMIGMAGYLTHLRGAPSLTAADALVAHGTMPL